MGVSVGDGASQREVVYAFTDGDWHGVRLGRLFLSVRDVERHRPLFSERNRIRCRHITVGRWRVLLRWR